MIDACGVVPAERLWQAGLDASGTRCFVSSSDEDLYVVDSNTRSVIAAFDDRLAVDDRPLGAMVDGDELSLQVRGEPIRFRIFGLNFGDGLTQSGGTSIRVDPASAEVVFSMAKGEQRLPYEAFSGDWAYCSLAQTGNVAAIIEPYEVRIFERVGLG